MPTHHTVKLPRKHSFDWWDRRGGRSYGKVLKVTERTVTFRLTDAGLADLIRDSVHHAAGKDNPVDDTDSPSAAERCLAALRRQGFRTP